MNIPDLVKETVKKFGENNEVILFGSRARGDYREDSDWDFLILIEADNISRKKIDQIREKLYQIELQTGAVISTIVHTKQEWKERYVTPLYKVIQEEGLRA